MSGSQYIVLTMFREVMCQAVSTNLKPSMRYEAMCQFVSSCLQYLQRLRTYVAGTVKLYVYHIVQGYRTNTVCILITSPVFNVRTCDGLTPLLVAAKYNRKNTVLWLLQDGRDLVDVDAVDNKGRNAIHLAVLDTNCGYTIEVCM